MDFRDIKEFFRDAFKYIVVIVVVLVVSLYILGISQVVGPSMQPTYEDGQVMVISKLNYVFGEVGQNDVVAYESEGVRLLIKRALGLPGQTIEYQDNYLYLDGKKYEETLYSDMVTENFKLFVIPDSSYPDDTTKGENDYGILSDDDMLLFIGDKVYRGNPETVNKDELELFVIPEDMYFMVGDNRSNSEDSRVLGLVKKEHLEGQILFKLWPLG